MHELALTQSIVETVAQHAQDRMVKRVTIEVGKLSCVMPDALRFSFDLLAAGTALDGAKNPDAATILSPRCHGVCFWH